MKSKCCQTKGLLKKCRNHGDDDFEIFFHEIVGLLWDKRQKASELLRIETSFFLANLPAKILQKKTKNINLYFAHTLKKSVLSSKSSC